MENYNELLELAQTEKSERERRVKEARERRRKQQQKTRTEEWLEKAERLEIMREKASGRAAAFVSEALAAKITTAPRQDVCQATHNLGDDGRQIGGVDFLSGKHLAAACSGGLLGGRARHRLTVTVLESLDECRTEERPPDDPNRTRPRQTIFDSLTGKVILPRLERKFEETCEALRERTIENTELDRQPHVCRSGAWAAKDGDPQQGIAESLADCLPLEIAWTPTRGGTVRWIVRA